LPNNAAKDGLVFLLRFKSSRLRVRQIDSIYGMEGFMMTKTYNLFISHSWSYSDAYEKIINLLDNKPNFPYRDFSIPKNDPVHNVKNVSELYAAIKRQMSPCHIVIILAGVYSTYSKWISREIKIANDEFSDPKPILAVRPWANRAISTVVSTNAEKVVGWNTESIVSAIRELSI
jgi:hypothetical protein